MAYVMTNMMEGVINNGTGLYRGAIARLHCAGGR